MKYQILNSIILFVSRTNLYLKKKLSFKNAKETKYLNIFDCVIGVSYKCLSSKGKPFQRKTHFCSHKRLIQYMKSPYSP